MIKEDCIQNGSIQMIYSQHVQTKKPKKNFKIILKIYIEFYFN